MTANIQDWLKADPSGIYLPASDAWVDPSRPVARAIITHGHSDHARGGHGEVWATAETLAIMAVRYPALWSSSLAKGQLDRHQHDAFSIATWLARAEQDGSLSDFLQPV